MCVRLSPEDAHPCGRMRGGKLMGDAKSDCDALLVFVLPVAEVIIMGDLGLYPFGGYMTSEGELATIGVGGPPDWQERVVALKDLFRGRASNGMYRATAVVHHLPLSSGPHADAIAVRLDHRDKYLVVAIRPYTAGGGYDMSGAAQIVYGETRFEPGDADIFIPGLEILVRAHYPHKT
jgi:hypothetical protein